MGTGHDLREHLKYLIRQGGAHIGFEDAIADIPPEKRGAAVFGSPHTLWRQLEHLRICQWDILHFSTSADHVSPEFPHGYWPDSNSPPSNEAWDECVQQFQIDRQAMIDLVMDPDTDLLKPIPHGDGQTILREALLVADHNAYHLGQIVAMRRTLGIWD